jgi:hypothetical protein
LYSRLAFANAVAIVAAAITINRKNDEQGRVMGAKVVLM